MEHKRDFDQNIVVESDLNSMKVFFYNLLSCFVIFSFLVTSTSFTAMYIPDLMLQILLLLPEAEIIPLGDLLNDFISVSAMRRLKTLAITFQVIGKELEAPNSCLRKYIF